MLGGTLTEQERLVFDLRIRLFFDREALVLAIASVSAQMPVGMEIDVGEAVMANLVHLFFCGSGFKGAGLFALTNDRSGANLPKADCPAGWAFAKSTEMTEGEVGGIAVDANVAAADLEKTGYHLIYARGKEAGAGKEAV
jgi:hypothetical protein